MPLSKDWQGTPPTLQSSISHRSQNSQPAKIRNCVSKVVLCAIVAIRKIQTDHMWNKTLQKETFDYWWIFRPDLYTLLILCNQVTMHQHISSIFCSKSIIDLEKNQRSLRWAANLGFDNRLCCPAQTEKGCNSFVTSSDINHRYRNLPENFVILIFNRVFSVVDDSSFVITFAFSRHILLH